MRVPPDCTKSSTMTTCLPLGDPSLSRTIRLSPSLTFVQITCSNGQDSGLREFKMDMRAWAGMSFPHMH